MEFCATSCVGHTSASAASSSRSRFAASRRDHGHGNERSSVRERYDFGNEEPRPSPRAPRGEAQGGTARAPSSGTELVRGQRAQIIGLSGRADLNGKFGTLLGLVADTGRWGMRIEDSGECVRLKPANIIG